MAFLDDISKKLTQAGQSAAQKTKEIAELAKMSAQVADEEKKMNENYLQIGKLYASLHAEECEPDYVAYLNAIRESEAKVKELKQQINDIKGIVKCEKCGAEVASGAAFCSSCGAPMPVATPEAESTTEDIVTEATPITDETQDC